MEDRRHGGDICIDMARLCEKNVYLCVGQVYGLRKKGIYLVHVYNLQRRTHTSCSVKSAFI